MSRLHGTADRIGEDQPLVVPALFGDAKFVMQLPLIAKGLDRASGEYHRPVAPRRLQRYEDLAGATLTLQPSADDHAPGSDIDIVPAQPEGFAETQARGS